MRSGSRKIQNYALTVNVKFALLDLPREESSVQSVRKGTFALTVYNLGQEMAVAIVEVLDVVV